MVLTMLTSDTPLDTIQSVPIGSRTAGLQMEYDVREEALSISTVRSRS